MTPADPYAEDDAAYVMGALTPGRRREYEAHLVGCPRCTAAVGELSGLPGLLGLVSASQVDDRPADPGPVPDTVLPGLVRRARHERRRRSLLVAAGSALVAACLVVGVVVAVGSGGSTPDGTRGPGVVVTALAAVTPVPVRATVRFQPVSWGTRIEVTCTYTAPPTGRAHAATAGGAAQTYRLVVIPQGGGAPESVVDWQSLPDREVTANGTMALTIRQVAAVQLQSGDGTVLLQGIPG